MNTASLRRARQSSSDCEIDNPPKKQNMDMTENPGLTLSDIMAAIGDLRDNQNSLRESMESRLDKIEKQFKKQIEQNMRNLRSDLSKDMETMNCRISELETKLCHMNTNAMGDALPEGARDQNTSSKVKLVIKNMPEFPDETSENLKERVSELLSKIDFNDVIYDVVRVTGYPSGTAASDEAAAYSSARPLPVLFNVSTLEQRSNILRNKVRLKDMTEYAKVYLDIDKSRHERVVEANIRNIVKSIPTLQFRKGRVVNK